MGFDFVEECNRVGKLIIKALNHIEKFLIIVYESQALQRKLGATYFVHGTKLISN